MPDIRSLTLTPEDQFIIVACDGIWNSLSSQEACDFVSERLSTMSDDGKLSAICEEVRHGSLLCLNCIYKNDVFHSFSLIYYLASSLSPIS